MKDYIEREAAIKSVYERCSGEHWEDILQSLPTADVQPVVRGEWKEYGEPNQRGEYELWYWKCSICGAIACHDEYNFCPNCGADMRGEYL